ncbi:MAG: manganese efflux pump MntP family protein [Oscillospiraceae bacterium]|jgi:putative Mn2+ efflux pump MntP|nr:manganese efflux pump MntP family protein [Oscillospiraceae bacterium]
MHIIELFLIAIGLAMDAFAIAICAGLTLHKANAKNALIVGAYFGVFQAGMPLLGYAAGAQFADKITAFDHWVAFAVLALIGGGMVRGSFKKDDEKGIKTPHIKTMLPLALATSIDALAVGVSFAFLDGVNIAAAVTAIGAVTFVMSFVGVFVGKAVGTKFKSKAELVGGIILIAMGVKILIEHTLG